MRPTPLNLHFDDYCRNCREPLSRGAIAAQWPGIGILCDYCSSRELFHRFFSRWIKELEDLLIEFMDHFDDPQAILDAAKARERIEPTRMISDLFARATQDFRLPRSTIEDYRRRLFLTHDGGQP